MVPTLVSATQWKTPLGPRDLTGMGTPTLLELLAHIESQPENINHGGFYKFTKKARNRKDAIAEQIAHNMAMARAAAGNPVVCDGYSGRKSNRRR